MQKGYSKQDLISWTERRKGNSLHASVALNNVNQIINILTLDNQLIHTGDLENSTPLHYACAVGDLKTIKLLIDNGADVHAVNIHKETPAHWTIFEPNNHKKHAKIKALISYGADINSQNIEGETLAHQCIKDPTLMLYLLNHGAQVNIKNIFEWTPLHYAVLFQECMQTTQYLIDFKADINAQDDEQLTPLHLAIKHNNINTIKLLIASGADLQTKNVDEQTPYDLAYCLGLHEETLKLLK